MHWCLCDLCVCEAESGNGSDGGLAQQQDAWPAFSTALLPESWGDIAVCGPFSLDPAKGSLWALSAHLSHGLFPWAQTPVFPLLFSKSIEVSKSSTWVYTTV